MIGNNKLMEMAVLAKSFAQCKISNYSVGAAALSKSGKVYLGFNLEFPGTCIQSTLHAEQFAFANAFIHQDHDIIRIAVTATPCGHCRQFMAERSICDITVLLNDESEIKELKLLEDLLPLAWQGSEQLSTINDSCEGIMQDSFAPYSGSKSACVLHAGSRSYSGVYIESPAFNPSISPLHSALVSFASSKLNLVISKADQLPESRDWDLHADFKDSIDRVVLTQVSDCQINQFGMCQDIVNSLSPNIEIENKQ